MTPDAQGPFAARRVATTGYEIITPHGEVIAWTVDGYWANIIVTLLTRSGLSDIGPHAASGGMGAVSDSTTTGGEEARTNT